MPTDEQISQRFPLTFMAAMLADIIGDFTHTAHFHRAIATAADGDNRIADIAEVLGNMLNGHLRAGDLTVDVYADAFVVTNRRGDQRGCLLDDFTIAQVAALLHIAPELINDHRDTPANFPDLDKYPDV
jgi:hypothetical protein